MKKVYLGVGHGGRDSGAVGYIVEKDVNLQIALACKEYLEANGVEVKISRTTDIDKKLTQRINECNGYNPDMAVDIHNNGGGGDGFEVYHTINGGTGKILAQNIEEEIKAIGQNSRGLKTKKGNNGDYFGFIRCIKCPSIITETVFVDNQADASQADELHEQKAFGQAIAKGILKTLGVSNNATVGKNETVQATKSIVDLANEVIAGKYGVGEARKQALGSLYNEVQAKVNEILLGKKTTVNKKSNEQIADEVIEGKWGNNPSRKEKLQQAGYDYNAIQKIVNQKLR